MKEFTPDNVVAVFQPQGPLHRVIPDYHYREEQASLAQEVAYALNNSEFLMAEAGTGVGKTLAYLIPAVALSLIHI